MEIEPIIHASKFKMNFSFPNNIVAQIKLSSVEEKLTAIEFMHISGDRKMFNEYYQAAELKLKSII
jgi:hypothetical protein